jgi:hypothetical protein
MEGDGTICQNANPVVLIIICNIETRCKVVFIYYYAILKLMQKIEIKKEELGQESIT